MMDTTHFLTTWTLLVMEPNLIIVSKEVGQMFGSCYKRNQDGKSGNGKSVVINVINGTPNLNIVTLFVKMKEEKNEKKARSKIVTIFRKLLFSHEDF